MVDEKDILNSQLNKLSEVGKSQSKLEDIQDSSTTFKFQGYWWQIDIGEDPNRLDANKKKDINDHMPKHFWTMYEDHFSVLLERAYDK